MFIPSILFDKAFDEGFDLLKKSLKSQKTKVTLKSQDLQESILHHQKVIDNLTRSISFREMLHPKATESIYIDLDIHLSQRRLLPLNSIESSETIVQVLAYDYHLIILGDPGAGKSTTLKNLTQRLLHDDSFLKNINFPILIELRDFSDEDNIFKRLSAILGLSILFENNATSKIFETHLEKNFSGLLCQYVDNLKILLLIDGLDELSEEKQKEILKEIRILFNSLNNSKVLLTCRSGAFDSNIENSSVYEICNLNESQINIFIHKWFDNVKKETDFKKELNKPAFKDFAFRPLTLSHLCALFEKHKRLPEKPKYIYKKLITLLLEDWDNERDVIRTSKFYNFETDRKYEFLSNLAYELTLSTSKKRFSEDQLLKCLRIFGPSFGLKEKELLPAINEIESQNGIFIKSSFNAYEFSHKSMQEYLTAEYIIRKGEIPYNLIAQEFLPNEMAIAVSLSSTPANDYFYKILYGIYLRVLPPSKIISEFLQRLYIEKPDFSKSAFLAFTIYYIYNIFYFSEEVLLNKTIQESEKIARIKFFEKNFIELFSNLLSINGVTDSFRLLYKIAKFKATIFNEIFSIEFNEIDNLPELQIGEIATFHLPTELYVTDKIILHFAKLK